MKNISNVLASWVLIALLSLTASCARIAGEEPKELVPLNSIGVLPAQPASIEVQPADDKTTARLEAGAQTLDTLLMDYFREYDSVRFISQTELESLQEVQTDSTLQLARAAGRQLGYDAILVTEVLRYRTRAGSAYAVDTPASVAFSFKLLAVGSGQIIWSADFDQTQQPLFENILTSRNTGSGFRWLTAAELTQAGLSKKLNSCPYFHKN